MAESLNLVAALDDMSANTRRAYKRWIRNLIATTYQVEETKIHLERLRRDLLRPALQPQYVRAWLETMQQAKYSQASLNQARSAIIWLAGWLVAQQQEPTATQGALMCVRTPTALPVPDRRTWLSASETQQLLEALAYEERPAVRARNTALLILMVTCGLRREEAATARWGDLTTHDHLTTLLIHGKGEKERTVVLPPITVQALEAWRGYHPMPYGAQFIFTVIKADGTVTTVPLTGEQILYIVKETGLRAGLDVTPHDLRRTFARGAFEAGADYEAIRQALGHSSAGTTQLYIGAEAQRDEMSAAQVWAATLTDNV